jgi:hypothetical protein
MPNFYRTELSLPGMTREKNVENQVLGDTEIALPLGDLLNAQAGRISWTELSVHFARGRLLILSPGQDMIAIAAKIIEDNAFSLEQLISASCLRRAEDKDAIEWQNRQSEFWAVVVAPWVLVQEVARVNQNDG